MLEFIGKQLRKPRGVLGRIVGHIMGKSNGIIYEELREILNLNDNENILEIGYGPGIGLNKIAKSNSKVNFYGVDFSKLMYDKANKINKNHIDNGNMKLTYGDILEYQSSTNFNKIYAINVVYFWKSPEEVFKKLYKFLCDSGELILFVVLPKDLERMKFTNNNVFAKPEPSEIAKTLEGVGFKKIEIRPLRTSLEEGVFIVAKKEI